MVSTIYKSSLIAAFILVVSGCAGHIYTIINPPLDQNNTKIEGVITYPQIGVYELYKMTLYFDKDKNTTNKNCKPEYETVYSVRSDYSHPQFVSYEPGIFENNTFKLDLKDGAIVSVNTTSNTTEALKEVTSVLKTFIPVPSTKFAQGKEPLCNTGKRLVDVYKAPSGLPFEQMKKDIDKDSKQEHN